MQYCEKGRICRGLGGLYEVLLDPGDTPASGGRILCRAKGNFRHEGLTPLVGDRVQVLFDETALPGKQHGTAQTDGGGAVIAEILPRTTVLIRPPMANLGRIFMVFSAARPMPVTETVDKMLTIADYAGVEPFPVITKSELDTARAAELSDIYRLAGFRVFSVSSVTGEGIDELRDFLSQDTGNDRISAFAGASGVGKSTLLNTLYPELALDTGEISRKIERGRHTTRRVELYPLPHGFLADTPGFSLLDFTRFDFLKPEELPFAMRDFRPYLGQCRYKKCTHTKEEGCAVLSAVRSGEIAPSRHAGFLSMYEEMRHRRNWS